ncbi:nuclear pore complex protein Nup160 homolog isoform X2 [Teleopsis dalmanni]|uniref:nuclear pore complex protein Nup160 homolog isoform X2 n=1 Tax=Teleopsis dalmanni TaxID=139649 RepID=UPI0018CE61C0|nr:nuclear pore complex protein Nup160 homolog isoform X2 [Teleopsis dalmanni]
MSNYNLSYREVVPDNLNQEEWIEITLNTGGTQSTLQDIKVSDKAGGYCFKNVALNHNRNRYIYWLSITETDRFVTLLVTTVSSLHRINFPHPDTLADGSSIGSSSSGSVSTSGTSVGASVDFNDSQSFSIFRDANSSVIRNLSTCYVLDAQTTSQNAVPHAANSFLSPNGDQAYFALACQTQVMFYIMNATNGETTVHQLRQHNIMPRLFSNIKGALIGRNDSTDAEYATSFVFICVNNEIYLVTLYRNDNIRVWSTSTLQIVCSISCLRESNEQRIQGPQSNLLRKISDSSVCAFLSHASGSEFVCIDINTDVGNSSGLSLVRRRVISAPQLDLTDFDITDLNIWALWSNAEGEFSVSNFCLERGSSLNWISAAMEPPPDRYCVGIEQGINPREAYCSYIFHPGKFEQNVLSKALSMFRRSNVLIETSNMSVLKDHVCHAIEEEIQNEIKDFDISDEEYIEVALRFWERFYSCCEQYHMKACQPVGLAILESIDAIAVVKKSTFSMLRPCETLEHLMLTGEEVDIQRVLNLHFKGREKDGTDLINLVTIIARIEKWLSEDVKIELDKKLYQLEMPNIVISKLADEILAGDPAKQILPRNFLVVLRQKLQNINDIRAAMVLLLESLRMDNGNPEAMQTHLNEAHSTRFLLSIGTLFGSHLGLSILSETVRQIAMIRFAICRNLLILQQVLIDTYILPVDILETLRSQYMPDTIIFLQSYYVMVWISETPVNMNSISFLETSVQRLNLLQLSNGSGRIYTSGGKSYAAPLLRVFLNAKGLYTSLALYADNFKTLANPTWQNTLLPLTTIVSQLIWAVSFNFVFGEWLFGTSQHIILEDYVRLLNSWCEWNSCSRQFILAVSLLDCGEAHKAYDLFLKAAKGVLKEQFLFDKILRGTRLAEQLESVSIEDRNCMEVNNQAIAQYYLKVIQLFEHHNALDHIINVSQAAIGMLDKGDPQLPMFQSIVFNNHLQLEHYEEAYHSLIYNAETSRRKDCLRQLVINLFSRKRLDLLMNFPYVGLYEELENIVESRARSLSIEGNEVYDFLYAFHVNNGNMRKASAIMYEQAMRLQLESDSIESVQKRCESLLVCMNALHLIDHRYRWIAKPVINEDNLVQMSNNFEAMETDNSNNKHKVAVLEIIDVKRELLQAEAFLQLSQKRKDVQSFFNAGPQELTIMLASSGLYTDAVKLANGFNISILPVFDTLTTACVHITEETANEVWSWLQENDLADLPHRNKAADMAWSLLKKLVIDNEKENSTEIRKCVVNKILNLNSFVPQWLYNDYKSENCSELLYLYVKHSRLLEAAELGKEFISAMLGAGSEYFSCKHSIAVTNAEMCLPLNTLDLLLHGLKLNENNVEYKEALIDLEEILNKYVNTALRTARDKIEISMRNE